MKTFLFLAIYTFLVYGKAHTQSECTILWSGNKWSNTTTPHYAIVNVPNSPTNFANLVRNAASAWTAKSTCFKLIEDATSTNTIDVSNTLGPVVNTPETSSGKAAETDWNLDVENQIIVGTNTYFNIDPTVVWSNTCPVPGSDIDVFTVALNEFGHWVGLDDNNMDENSAMGLYFYQKCLQDVTDDVSGCPDAIYCNPTGICVI